MNLRASLLSVLPALALLVFVSSSFAAERVALIMGNGAYEHAKVLPNPTNDAADVGDALQAAGWSVTRVENAGIKDMVRALREFCEKTRGADAAVFFYAGHGVEVKGRNYLLPVDAELAEGDGEDALPLETLALDKVLADLGQAGVRLKTVVLDCCRDNPLSRSWLASRSSGGGLAALDEKQLPEGTMLVFSTAPGKTAADGRSRNSPFTAALLTRIQSGGGGIVDVFGDVAKSLGDRQPAWIRFDGSGVSFTAFRDYPLVPGGRGNPPSAPTPRAPISDPFGSVTKTTPFSNSLGMKFVPAATPGVLFSVWETRVQDFTAFVEDTHHDAIGSSTFGGPAFTLEKTEDGKGAEWAQKGGSWQNPHFPSKQTGEHPVVCVSYLDAEAFCAWLTQKDRASGKIPATASYRLPSDSEWSRACGSSTYPWGDSYPPKSGAGNYSGKEAMVGVLEGFSNDLVKAGRRDSAARTSGVGMFEENRYGLYDMGGNVQEWCSTWYEASMNEADVLDAAPLLKDDKGGQTYRVLRGGSWYNNAEIYLRSSCRIHGGPRCRHDGSGFRCVLVMAGG